MGCHEQLNKPANHVRVHAIQRQQRQEVFQRCTAIRLRNLIHVQGGGGRRTPQCSSQHKAGHKHGWCILILPSPENGTQRARSEAALFLGRGGGC